MIDVSKNKWPKRWITSDWHIGDDRMHLLMRPFMNQTEHMNAILNRHNAVVSPEDLVIVVGDAVCKDPNELGFLKFVEKFNGHKILIRGNHDRNYSDEQLSEYFEWIVSEGDGIEVEVEVGQSTVSCWATHYPSQAREDRFNLVGHVHSAWKVQLNSLNIGVDCQGNYSPHPLDEFVPFAYRFICEHADEDIWAAYNHSNQSFKDVRGKKGSYFSGV